MSSVPSIRRAAAVLTIVPLYFAFAPQWIGVRWWGSPPAFVLERAGSLSASNTVLLARVLVTVAVSILFVVGLYLARNWYRWTTAAATDGDD